ncbi:hypothetical protein P4S70_10900 [Enterovibrio sp. Hal110]
MMLGQKIEHGSQSKDQQRKAQLAHLGSLEWRATAREQWQQHGRLCVVLSRDFERGKISPRPKHNMAGMASNSDTVGAFTEKNGRARDTQIPSNKTTARR